MKIQNVNNMPIESLSRNDIDENVNFPETELVFRSKLTAESKSVYERQIRELVRTIEAQGKRLAERADMGEMQKYREMITQLLHETVSNGFAFHKEGKIGINGRSKIFAMIKTVNEKLDSMTKKLLAEEKENIDLLDDIDDIRGLLVDMYL